MRIFGILIGVTVAAAGQAALASSQELVATTAEAQISKPDAPAAPIPKPEAAAELLTGPEVYNAVCVACHAPPGIGGAPALGDQEAWAGRIAQGPDTLIHNALTGYTGETGVMPKKGGRLDLSDEEIIAAVTYMVEQSAQ